MKAVYPALTADEARALDRSFLDYSAYRLDIRMVTATFRGEGATVDCALDMTATLRSGTTRRS